MVNPSLLTTHDLHYSCCIRPSHLPVVTNSYVITTYVTVPFKIPRVFLSVTLLNSPSLIPPWNEDHKFCSVAMLLPFYSPEICLFWEVHVFLTIVSMYEDPTKSGLIAGSTSEVHAEENNEMFHVYKVLMENSLKTKLENLKIPMSRNGSHR